MTEIIITIFVTIILITGIVVLVLNQKKSVKEWLILAVSEAEKALGTKTGQLKLRLVFESFIKIFPIFSKFVPFETFSKWVDFALVEMKKMITSNKTVNEYIKGDKNDTILS